MKHLLTLACIGLLAALFVRADYKRVCYYSNTAQYGEDNVKFYPEDIDPILCSHLVYTFAAMSGNRLSPTQWNDNSTVTSKGLYERFNDLKFRSSVKTLLAVEDWDYGTNKMTSMMKTAESRREFATTSIDFLRKRNFDGLEIYFNYVGGGDSLPEDKFLFTSLLKELRAVFNAEGVASGRQPLLLTAAVRVERDSIDRGYEVREIAKYLDYIGLNSHGFYSPYDSVTGLNSPLYPARGDSQQQAQKTLEWAATYWESLGAPKEKLVIGVATYGNGYTLADSGNHGIGSNAVGPNKEGKYSRGDGYLCYYEICPLLSDSSATRVWSDDQQVPYLYKGNQWISYEDKISLTLKVLWLRSRGYGGWVVWALDLDDFKGQFCNEGRYPLLRALNSALVGGVGPSPRPSDTTTSTRVLISQPSGNPCASPDASVPTHPYPNDCTKFIQCSNGMMYVMQCPSGIVFDPDLYVCNWSWALSPERRQQCGIA